MKDDDYINLATRISEDNIKAAEADRKRHQLNEKRSRYLELVGVIANVVGTVIDIISLMK